MWIFFLGEVAWTALANPPLKSFLCVFDAWLGPDFGVLSRTQTLVKAHAEGVPVLQALLSQKDSLGRGAKVCFVTMK